MNHTENINMDHFYDWHDIYIYMRDIIMYDAIKTFLLRVTYKKEREAGRKTRREKLRRVISAIQPKLNQGREKEIRTHPVWKTDAAHLATFMGTSLC